MSEPRRGDSQPLHSAAPTGLEIHSLSPTWGSRPRLYEGTGCQVPSECFFFFQTSFFRRHLLLGLGEGSGSRAAKPA